MDSRRAGNHDAPKSRCTPALDPDRAPAVLGGLESHLVLDDREDFLCCTSQLCSDTVDPRAASTASDVRAESDINPQDSDSSDIVISDPAKVEPELSDMADSDEDDDSVGLIRVTGCAAATPGTWDVSLHYIRRTHWHSLLSLQTAREA